jgi:hypothetical protein
VIGVHADAIFDWAPSERFANHASGVSFVGPGSVRTALETRRRIRLAAQTLLLRDGYVRTSMTAVAAQAGVAEKTVYLAYATKAALLDEIIRTAIRARTAPSPWPTARRGSRCSTAPRPPSSWSASPRTAEGPHN